MLNKDQIKMATAGVKFIGCSLLSITAYGIARLIARTSYVKGYQDAIDNEIDGVHIKEYRFKKEES